MNLESLPVRVSKKYSLRLFLSLNSKSYHLSKPETKQNEKNARKIKTSRNLRMKSQTFLQFQFGIQAISFILFKYELADDYFELVSFVFIYSFFFSVILRFILFPPQKPNHCSFFPIFSSKRLAIVWRNPLILPSSARCRHR